MSDLQIQIKALTDAEAIALLRRFIRAVSATLPSPEAMGPRAKGIADALSLAAGPEQPMSPGELARSALLLLANDARFQSSLQAIVATGRSTFSRGDQRIDAADLMAVLQTQMPDLSVSVVQPGSGAAAQPGLVRALAHHLIRTLGVQPSSPQADAEYHVWYATSRKPLDRANPSLGFGVERDDRIHHGICKVFIPKSHKVGSTGSPWWKRLLTGTDDRLRMLAKESLQAEAFWQQLRQHLGQCAVEDQDAVVFIHGFNVSFEEAALRAAQIGFDLQIKGAMAFYSWASRGDVTKYLADTAAVELDETPIADFLCDMALRTGARRVHVIAHSMGNRAVLRAVNQIAERRSGVHFGQVILAAADVDARKFRELGDAYRQLSDRTTLYVSTRDFAVEASRWLHDFHRAGLMPPVTTVAGIDTVNAANVDLSLLGHGYVAEAREVISDIHAMIRHGAGPEQRFGLRRATAECGASYWLIDA